MNDRECVALLTWALPRLGLRWRGFKDLRRQVCRRIIARAAELGVATADEYRARIEADPAELTRLDALCFVTISRFYRDAPVFDALRHTHLPRLAEAARARGTLRVWSAGCASGEEAYTIAILWHLELAARFPDVTLSLLATDRDATVLRRARAAVYPASSLRELPPDLRAHAFEPARAFEPAVAASAVAASAVAASAVAASAVAEPAVAELRLRADLRAGVHFEARDLRTFVPPAPQDLVLCRNAVFTYFDEPSQRAFLDRLPLVPGGLLILGKGESRPGP
ncbi:MAG: chemotaxis protein CheR [Labilithrix sp.]|nr:chemotaxis protein CheR [Labilithrix sp.]